MDRVKLHYMKEQLLHQVLQRLAATYSTLNRRLGLAAAVHCLTLTGEEEKEEGKSTSTILGIEERHLHQLASNTPEVCLIVVRWYRQWWGYFPVAEGENSQCTD